MRPRSDVHVVRVFVRQRDPYRGRVSLLLLVKLVSGPVPDVGTVLGSQPPHQNRLGGPRCAAVLFRGHDSGDDLSV